jgi:hypothetical protein
MLFSISSCLFELFSLGPSLPDHVAQPHQPFEHEIDKTRPQHRADPMARRLVLPPAVLVVN